MNRIYFFYISKNMNADDTFAIYQNWWYNQLQIFDNDQTQKIIWLSFYKTKKSNQKLAMKCQSNFRLNNQLLFSTLINSKQVLDFKHWRIIWMSIAIEEQGKRWNSPGLLVNGIQSRRRPPDWNYQSLDYWLITAAEKQ